jgi:ribosomal protein S18 acetylase RimI-like enzyme
MNIRSMHSSDFAELTALWGSFPGTTTTGADTEEGFGFFLDRNRAHCFVATDRGGAVRGSVMAGNDCRRGYIYHLAVEEGLQKQGTGRLLMEAAENSLRAAGIEKAHLFIYGDNPAVSFYERIGWHRRTDIEVMSRVLTGEQYMGTRRGDD